MRIDKKRLREQMARRLFGVKELADAYGCKRQWVQTLLAEDKPITTKTAGKLAKALDCDVLDIIETEK